MQINNEKIHEIKINYVHAVNTCIDSYMFCIDTTVYKVYDERGCLQQKQTWEKSFLSTWHAPASIGEGLNFKENCQVDPTGKEYIKPSLKQ